MNFHLKCFHISHDTSKIVLHVIKQCLRAFCYNRNWFSKKLMCKCVVEWKNRHFFDDSQKTKVNQKTDVDFLKTTLLPECRRLYPDNDFVFVQDSAPSYRTNATQNFLRDNTPDFISSQEWTTHSPDLNTLDYSVWVSCRNLSTKEGMNHLRISTIFRMLSATNGTMSMTRQSEKLYSSGKGVWQLWQSRMEDLFSTFSADQLTDTNFCDVLV